MSDRYKHVSDCLEVARNARYCAGAEKAATEIDRLRTENEQRLEMQNALCRLRDEQKVRIEELQNELTDLQKVQSLARRKVR